MEKINLRYYRHFLICNRIASETLKKREGIYIANFAKLIFQELNGVWCNAQMTVYFWAADAAIAHFSEVDSGYVFDALDDLGYSMESLANISEAELESEYRKVQLAQNQDTTNTIKCKYCGEEFTKNAPRHVFCSDQCRIEFWEKRTGKKVIFKPKKA